MSNNVSVALFGQDVSLSATGQKAATNLHKSAGDMESSGTKIKNALGGAFSTLQNTGVLGEYGESVGLVGEAVDKLGEKHGALGAKLAATGGIVAGAGLGMSALASKDKSAQQQLAAAIGATGNSWGDYSEDVEKTIRSQEKYGHTADQTQQALATLTSATGDPQKALENMGLTANLAAARHESLTAAADQVAKIMGGKGGKTLALYGISMKDAAGKTKTTQQVTEELAKKLNGQASAATDTFTGKLHAMGARVTDVASATANKLGPALTIVGPAISAVGAVMEIMKARAVEAAVAERGMALASEEAGASTMIAFGPILLILAAIGIAAYLLYKNWDTIWSGIKAVTSAALDFVTGIFTTVIGFITDHWQLFAMGLATILLGPLGLMAVYVATHFDQIKGYFATFIGWFTGLPGRIASVGANMWSWMATSFKGVINTVIGMWDWFADHMNVPSFTIIPGTPLTDPVKFPGMKLGGYLHVPMLAGGGTVKATPGGVLALLGEGGHDERVTPLDGREDAGREVHLHLHTNAILTNGRDAAAFFDQMVVEARSMGWIPSGRGLLIAS